MDIAELRKLVKLMNENELIELEIEEQGSTIRLKKAAPVVSYVQSGTQLLPASGSQAAGGSRAEALGPDGRAPAAPAAPLAPAVPAGPPPGTEEIRSPIVGTFYRSASPESPSYVNVGDRIKVDSVVCIIEAMKVMNEIKAERGGEVVEILVENGEAVEYDQPLFRIKVD